MREVTMIPVDNRIEPPLVGDEATLVTGFLDYQRQTLAWKCAGLTPSQLATKAVPTSDVTLLGLVRHLAAVETGWLVGFGGLPYEIWPDVIRDWDDHWRVDSGHVTQEDVDIAWATWRAAADAARHVGYAGPRAPMPASLCGSA
jgi:hypothetical protein